MERRASHPRCLKKRPKGFPPERESLEPQLLTTSIPILGTTPTPVRTTHMVLTAELEGEQVKVMVDSGANRSYASTRLGSILKNKKQDKQCPYPLTMADCSPVEHDDGWIRKELHEVQLTIAQHQEIISLDIVNIKYDIILGMI